MSLVREYIKENFLEEVITYKVKKGKEEEFIEFLDENSGEIQVCELCGNTMILRTNKKTGETWCYGIGNARRKLFGYHIATEREHLASLVELR